ncbi:hypothetical protein D3C86_1148860 [compost metagenome]
MLAQRVVDLGADDVVGRDAVTQPAHRPQEVEAAAAHDEGAKGVCPQEVEQFEQRLVGQGVEGDPEPRMEVAREEGADLALELGLGPARVDPGNVRDDLGHVHGFEGALRRFEQAPVRLLVPKGRMVSDPPARLLGQEEALHVGGLLAP